MELLEALYRRRLRKKQKKSDMGRSEGVLCRSPSETSVNRLATGLLSRVLRFTTRRSEPTSRPHSWHSTKLGAGGPNPSQPEQLSTGGMDSLHTPWHQGYPHHHQASVSTTDLCVGWDSEFSYLRRSPDQYSSRESLDSLDPPPPSQSRAEPLQPPLDPHDHRDRQQTLTHASTRSSNSMDLLHNKRDSAYSSFSTSSSIPEYLASAPSLSSERCYSLESVPQRGREGDGCYSLESVSQRGREGECPHSHAGFMRSELTSAASLGNSLSQERGVLKPGSADGDFYRGNSSSAGSTGGGVHGSKRHSVGPIWGPTAGPGSSDGLKEAPGPPHGSDSYPVTRTHERPNSWSSLDHARSLRPLHKGSWHHSSGSVATAKGAYAADVQLHTVVEKSPESSPTTKPRQGGGPSPGVPNAGPPGAHPPPYSQGPPSQGQPALGARDPQLRPDTGAWNGGEEEVETVKGRRDGGEVEEVKRCGNGENAYQNSLASVMQPHWSASSSSSSSSSSFSPLRDKLLEADRAEAHHHQVLPRVAQGQVAPARTPQTPSHPPTTTSQPQPIPQASQSWIQAQQEHPLTRLEMALAEVQRCASLNNVPPIGGSQANSGGSRGSSPTLSVLEKVNRFERRQHSVRQRSLSNHSYSLQGKLDQSGRSSPCGAEDLRNMLERSGSKAHRTMSYRGRSSEHTQHRNPADPTTVLLRSCSTFHLKDPKPEETPQPLLCPDNSFSSSYRDSLKDAQSKVLDSTSFRRRDLSSSLKAPPSALLFQRSTSSSPGLPSSSSSSSSSLSFGQLSLERKGPKTKPKPQRVVLTSFSSSSVAPPPVPSPHTPRERHTVGPPPAPPNIPTLGPPLVGRVCGRKRLSVQQKKRSSSEPDSMHEVGVSDPETSALFRRGAGESSVADRRRMFEGAVHSIQSGDGPRPQSAGPQPQALRQAQQDALAQYIQRKRTEKREQERPQRPHSYLQPNSDKRTVVPSLYSASSLLSLRESCPDWTLLPGEGWPSSPQPPGAQSSVSNPRPPSSGTEPASLPTLHAGAPGPGRQPRGPSPDQGLSQIVHGALHRARLSVSASAEDLLEERETGDQQLHRCLSTPPGITSQHQGVGEVSMTTLPTAEALQQPDRPMNTQPPEGHAPSSDPALHHHQADVTPGCSAFAAPQGASESRPTITRRERPHISSPLAASVGLPCLSLPPHPASPAPHPASPTPLPVTSPQKSLNPGGDGLAGETMATAGMDDGDDRANGFPLPLPPFLPYSQRRLPSLRISESGFLSLSQPSDMSQPVGDMDDVFLPFPPPPTTESDLREHSPPLPPPPPSSPPPPQLEVEEGTGIQGDHPFTMQTAASAHQSSHPVPCFGPGGLISPGAQDSLELKYQPLPRREASAQELRVQVLLGQLVLRDRSLAPLTDTLWSKRTIELMDEVFHGLALDGTSPWQRRDGSIGEKQRVQDTGSPGEVGGLETALDDQQKDLNGTKEELCDALRRRVEELQEEKEILQEELRQHRALGAGVEAVVQDCCRPNEREKYRVFIGDLEKVVNLLLSLSGRLARTEAALHYLEERQEDCMEEKASLLLKRSQLLSQREDALELKENLERRQRIVHSLLTGHMTPDQLLLYRQLVSTKPSLLIRQRHLDDLIRQGEEHLVLIKETLQPHVADETDTSRGYQLSVGPAPYPSPATPQLPAHTARGTAVTSL